MHKKPMIACEMRIRKVHAYSGSPAYEMLLYVKGDKCWRALTMSNGSRAWFTAPPSSEEEARSIIAEFEKERYSNDTANKAVEAA